MSSHKNCDSEMSEVAAIVHVIYPGHPMKRVAGVMSVPLDTVRHWLYRRVSAARRRELALALLAELDRQDAERAAVRRQLTDWAGGDDEVGRLLAGPDAGEDRTRPKHAAD